MEQRNLFEDDRNAALGAIQGADSIALGPEHIEPYEGTSVYVITEDDVLDGDEYAFRVERALYGGDGSAGGNVAGDGAPRGDGAAGTPEVAVSKESRQVSADQLGATRWAVPRVDPNDLLLFMDFNVWHRRSVTVKALLVGGLGWHLKIGGKVVYDPRNGVDRAPEHPIVRLLKRPNPDRMQTFEDLVHRVLVDYGAMGNAYFEVAHNRRGDVAELYHAPARTMRRDRGFQGYWQVKQTRSRAFGNFGERATGRNEILHLYEYDPASDYYGMPGWYAALAQMGLERTIVEFNTKLFSNSLMAHMAVVVEGGKLSTSARDALKAFVKERATGVENAGRILLLEDERSQAKIRFEKLNLEVKDLMITRALEHFRDVVVGAHGVPPRLLGIMTPGQLGATGEIEGQLRTFRETVLRPGKQKLETALHVLFEEMCRRPTCASARWTSRRCGTTRTSGRR